MVEPESEAQGDRETNDGPTTNGVVQRAVITVGGAPAEPVEEEEDDTVKPLPDRLITELTNVLARTVGLDMAAVGWNPTVDNYLGRVTKPSHSRGGARGERRAIGTAHRPPQEARHGDGGRRLLHCEHRLGCPEPLRTPSRRSEPRRPTAGDDAEGLPAFLADEDEPVAAPNENTARHRRPMYSNVRGGFGRPATQAAAIPIAGCRILRGRGRPGRI